MGPTKILPGSQYLLQNFGNPLPDTSLPRPHRLTCAAGTLVIGPLATVPLRESCPSATRLYTPRCPPACRSPPLAGRTAAHYELFHGATAHKANGKNRQMHKLLIVLQRPLDLLKSELGFCLEIKYARLKTCKVAENW